MVTRNILYWLYIIYYILYIKKQTSLIMFIYMYDNNTGMPAYKI